MAARKTITYKVYITPLSQLNTYGTEVEVTDKVYVNGIKNIKKSIDSSDYDFGVYVYSDLQLTAYNKNGFFNEVDDYRSMFRYQRDLAKVRVVFSEFDSSDEETTTISFKGLINEEATRVDVENNTISFRVLSLDSVIRNTKVSGGAITSGMTPKQAMFAILNTTRISSVLNVSLSNINPEFNTETIDDGGSFDDDTAKSALDSLLAISNSVMVIDSSDNVIISPRTEDTDTNIKNLYGRYSFRGPENIISLKNYNTGKHRTFNSVKINDTEVSDSELQTQFGVRQKSISIDYITDTTKLTNIATNLLTQFKVPKVELVVTCPTRDVKDCDLLDRVSVDYPLRLQPDPGDLLPIYGITKYNSSNEPYPRTFGSIEIGYRIAFKIIEIIENPTNFTTQLKLRQVGYLYEDGVFDVAGNSIYGFAVYGEAVYIAPTEQDSWYNPSVLGAAQYGKTTYS